MYYRNGERNGTRTLYRRAQSARETYHPAITDLSEQALTVTNGLTGKSVVNLASNYEPFNVC